MNYGFPYSRYVAKRWELDVQYWQANYQWLVPCLIIVGVVFYYTHKKSKR